jgi:hypothetical protein
MKMYSGKDTYIHTSICFYCALDEGGKINPVSINRKLNELYVWSGCCRTEKSTENWDCEEKDKVTRDSLAKLINLLHLA